MSWKKARASPVEKDVENQKAAKEKERKRSQQQHAENSMDEKTSERFAKTTIELFYQHSAWQ